MSIKKVTIIAIMIIIMIAFSGCKNIKTDAKVEIQSTTQMAIIKLPNGDVIHGNLENYVRYSNDWISIIIDGVEYKTSTINVAFIYE